jgi:hypothetical protein
VIPTIVATSPPEIDTKPNVSPSGVYGTANATGTKRDGGDEEQPLGRLRNNGRLVRISSAARSSVSSDDVPHPLEREDVA